MTDTAYSPLYKSHVMIVRRYKDFRGDEIITAFVPSEEKEILFRPEELCDFSFQEAL